MQLGGFDPRFGGGMFSQPQMQPDGFNQGNFMNSTMIGDNNSVFNNQFSTFDQSGMFDLGMGMDGMGGGMDMMGMGGFPSMDSYGSYGEDYSQPCPPEGGGDDQGMMMIILIILALVGGLGGGGGMNGGGDCDIPGDDGGDGGDGGTVDDDGGDDTTTTDGGGGDTTTDANTDAETTVETTDGGATGVSGDPHYTTLDGTVADIQSEPGKKIKLLQTDDGKSQISGEIGIYNNPDLTAKQGIQTTVFSQKVVKLDDGDRVRITGDGVASLVDGQGNKIRDLANGETIASDTDANEKVTYDATNKTLNYTLNGTNGSTASGTIRATVDPNGNYNDTKIDTISGKFGGALAWLKPSFNGVTVDVKNGLHAFKDDTWTIERFYINSIFS